MPGSKLIPITYYNASKEIRLSAYADIIIMEPDGTRLFLRCIRFGGYPEMVQAMYDAIYAGAIFEAAVGNKTYHIASEPKRFIRQITHDGVYAEATMLAKDDDQEIQQPNHDAEENDAKGRKDNHEEETTVRSQISFLHPHLSA